MNKMTPEMALAEEARKAVMQWFARKELACRSTPAQQVYDDLRASVWIGQAIAAVRVGQALAAKVKETRE